MELATSNRSEVPLVIPRDKCSIRGDGVDSRCCRGEISEDEALLEEEEGQAQAATALKRKRKKKSPVWIGPLKRKRPESASQARDLGEVSIKSTLVCHYFLLFTLINHKGFLTFLMSPTRR